MDKKDQKNKRFNYRRFNLEGATNAHVIILVLVGAYVIYMIYMMISNYQNGETSMKLSTMVLVTVIMFAIVAVCFGYASYIFYIIRNKERIGREQDLENGYIDEYGNPLDEDGNLVDSPAEESEEAEESDE